MTDATSEERENRKSKVRVYVTYSAAAFLFGGGAVMIATVLLLDGENSYQEAKDIFLTILPVSAAVISYWFAGRSNKPSVSNQEKPANTGDAA